MTDNNTNDSIFPSAVTLFRGAILGTIAKSIATAQSPTLDTLQSWSNDTYAVQGWDGRYGAITFAGPQDRHFDFDKSLVVGAFFSAKSPRRPRVDAWQSDLRDVFRGCPDHQWRLIEERTLQFLLFEIFPEGPCATTGFWTSGELLTAAEPWTDVLENGADIIKRELIENFDEALNAWVDEFSLSTDEAVLAQAIFERKMDRPNERLSLLPHEAAHLASIAKSPDAFATCQTSFADIGIELQ